MISGIINSSLPIHERGNPSIFISIGPFVMVGGKFEATRHQLIGEGFREAQALLILVILLRHPERKSLELVQEPMRFSVILPWHQGFISYAIMVDGNKQVCPQVIGALRSFFPAFMGIRT